MDRSCMKVHCALHAITGPVHQHLVPAGPLPAGWDQRVGNVLMFKTGLEVRMPPGTVDQ